MTKLLIDVARVQGAVVTHYCNDCYLDRDMYKCHLAIGRHDRIYLDDQIYYLRPDECKNHEFTLLPREFFRGE